jgi:hypothetical protein
MPAEKYVSLLITCIFIEIINECLSKCINAGAICGKCSCRWELLISSDPAFMVIQNNGQLHVKCYKIDRQAEVLSWFDTYNIGPAEGKPVETAARDEDWLPRSLGTQVKDRHRCSVLREETVQYVSSGSENFVLLLRLIPFRIASSCMLILNSMAWVRKQTIPTDWATAACRRSWCQL